MNFAWFNVAQAYIEAAAQDASLLSSVGDNPFVNSMEREIERWLGLQSHRVVAVSSATAGMVAVLRGWGVGPGDEVIVPALGWGQTLNPVLEVGATPVFVDVETGGVNLDLDQVEGAISPRTRTVLAAEVFGIPLDWRRLGEIAGRTGLLTIVDAAQSFGAIQDGPMPSALIFSFGRGKWVCGGEGGAVATTHSASYDAVLLATQHPIRTLQNLQTDIPFDMVDAVSPNARIHPFAAALVAAQVRHFQTHHRHDHQRISTVRDRLAAAGFRPVPVPPGTEQAPPIVPIRTDQSEALLDFCHTHGWTVQRCCQKSLLQTPTVKNAQYLPARGYLSVPQRQIYVRHTRCQYPEAVTCAESLYLIDLFTS